MNMRKIYILLLLTLLTLSQFCQAQNFPYRHFDPILPMTAEEINCMYFDKEVSEYGVMLAEKQKAKYTYGVLERQ